MSTNADNLFPGADNLNVDVYANDRRPGTDLSLTKNDAPDPAPAARHGGGRRGGSVDRTRAR